MSNFIQTPSLNERILLVSSPILVCMERSYARITVCHCCRTVTVKKGMPDGGLVIRRKSFC